uniref:Uncharacterized protein n=1 Tax=Oryza punctata TaxID=4537 RepID=A0A0E0KPY5_ORYPU
MAGPYAPQLTRWRAAVGGGVVRDFVEHAGNVIALRPEDYYHRIGSFTTAGEDDDEDDGDGYEDLRERVLLGGRLYPVADETMIHGGGGRTLRCVEFCPEPGVAPLRLTVTRTAAAAGREEEKQQQEVAEVVSPDGAVRVLGCGECYGDGGGGGESGTVQHVVDVAGEREVFVLLVSVRHELARIVRVQRLT